MADHYVEPAKPLKDGNIHQQGGDPVASAPDPAVYNNLKPQSAQSHVGSSEEGLFGGEIPGNMSQNISMESQNMTLNSTGSETPEIQRGLDIDTIAILLIFFPVLRVIYVGIFKCLFKEHITQNFERVRHTERESQVIELAEIQPEHEGRQQRDGWEGETLSFNQKLQIKGICLAVFLAFVMILVQVGVFFASDDYDAFSFEGWKANFEQKGE